MEPNKLSDFIVNKNESTLSAMKKLDSNANKIIFIVDDEGKLVGSLTDGDIRRWILADKDLKMEVEFACHQSPVSISKGYIVEDVKDLMKSKFIDSIPVINNNRTIIDIIFWRDLFQFESNIVPVKQLDIPVVIMAGGFGQRLKPFTTILPKPLIPIGDKTIAEHIIDRFLIYGIKKFFMTLNHKSRIIKSYFEEIDKDYDLKFVVENKPLGTAGSLKLIMNELDDVFIVTNCDIMIYANYADIVDFHISNKYDLTLVSSMMHYKIPYGICETGENGKLLNIREKPEYNFLISTGMYIVNKKILNYIPDDEFFHITHLMDKVREKNGTIGAYPISENSWDDTGEWEEYNKTVKRLTND